MEKEYNTEAALSPGAEQEQPVVDAGTRGQGALQDLDKKELSAKDQAYISGLMKIMHSKKTAPMVDEF
jgi:hypothetical protein